MHSTKFSSKLAFSAACLAAASVLWSCAETPEHKSTGQAIDDGVITAKVRAKLVDDFALKGFKIGVDTNHGVVQLSGTVSTQTGIAQAVADATSVDGVVSVQNNIVLTDLSQ